MPLSSIKCPLCTYEGPLSMFESVDGNTLKCRRCRNRFDDPDIYDAGTMYADCDSRKAVFRFPFALNGSSTEVRVRPGYQALVLGNNGQKQWLEAGDHMVTDMPDGFQVYYVCLKPTVIWGSQNDGGFGAYGTARLALAPDYAKRYTASHDHIMTLDLYLKSLVENNVTQYIQQQTECNGLGRLELMDGYQSLLGVLEEGAAITALSPLGFRNAKGGTGSFSSYTDESIHDRNDIPATTAFSPPVEIIPPKQSPYTVRVGTELVLVRGAAKAERHKADEMLTAEQMSKADKAFLYRKKTFDFPYGWGVSNQACSVCGYFSAQGTISFYIDSTEKMSLLLNRTEGWQGFEDQMFFNVIRQEISATISRILNEYIGGKGVKPEHIHNSLSAMSILLTDLLNGQENERKDPVFRQYGLRVKRADILDITLYSIRR